MCYRMRQRGWKIHKLNVPMALHDAGMTRFSQWWKRAMRSGHAYAEGNARHGNLLLGFRAREVRSILFWALGIPLAVVVLTIWLGPVLLLLLSLYGVQWWRIRASRLRVDGDADDATLFACFCVLGKFAELLGMLRYWLNRVSGKKSALIEYKGVPPSATPKES